MYTFIDLKENYRELEKKLHLHSKSRKSENKFCNTAKNLQSQVGQLGRALVQGCNEIHILVLNIILFFNIKDIFMKYHST